MMNGSTLRPRYVSYLPAAYLDQPDGFLARFVGLFEALMSGMTPTPRRLLESWVALDELPGALAPEIAREDAPEDDRPLRYDRENRRLVFVGEMSAARRDELKGLVAGLPASVADAIDDLHARSEGRYEDLPGLEQILDGIARYSDPFEAPAPMTTPDRTGVPDQGFFDDDFVAYLARWVGLTFRQGWSDAKKRRLIQSIVPLYKRRGTVEGLRRYLEIFVESPVSITEELGIQVGVRSTVAVDTTVGGLPHMFNVEISYGLRNEGGPALVPFDFEFLRLLTENTVEIVDLEKPAHTDYHARYRFPGIIVGAYATVQRDTLIWPHGEPEQIR